MGERIFISTRRLVGYFNPPPKKKISLLCKNLQQGNSLAVAPVESTLLTATSTVHTCSLIEFDFAGFKHSNTPRLYTVYTLAAKIMGSFQHSSRKYESVTILTKIAPKTPIFW